MKKQYIAPKFTISVDFDEEMICASVGVVMDGTTQDAGVTSADVKERGSEWDEGLW